MKLNSKKIREVLNVAWFGFTIGIVWYWVWCFFGKMEIGIAGIYACPFLFPTVVFGTKNINTRLRKGRTLRRFEKALIKYRRQHTTRENRAWNYWSGGDPFNAHCAHITLGLTIGLVIGLFMIFLGSGFEALFIMILLTFLTPIGIRLIAFTTDTQNYRQKTADDITALSAEYSLIVRQFLVDKKRLTPNQIDEIVGLCQMLARLHNATKLYEPYQGELHQLFADVQTRLAKTLDDVRI